jgi:uncharacterized protein YkwD
MTRKTFLLFLLFFVTTILPAPLSVSAQKTSNAYKEMTSEIFRLVNEHRKSMGLKPLIINEVMSQAAEDHSRNMANGKTPFGHEQMDERVAKINKQLKQHASSWAENVATGQRTAKAAVDKWLSSQGHRENIEGDYNIIGIGIAKDANGTLFFTQIFIKKSL